MLETEGGLKPRSLWVHFSRCPSPRDYEELNRQNVSNCRSSVYRPFTIKYVESRSVSNPDQIAAPCKSGG